MTGESNLNIFKEIMVGIKMSTYLTKDLKLELKLVKHRNKMINTYLKYKSTEFANLIVQEWREKLLRKAMEAVGKEGERCTREETQKQ